MCPPSMSSPLLRSRASAASAAGPPASSVGASAPRAPACRSTTNSDGAPSPSIPPQKKKRSLVARLGQSFNPSGIALFGKILLSPSSAPLLLPHLTVRDVSCLDWEALAEAGFKAAVFDKDNTLTAPYSLELTDAATTSLGDAARALEGGRSRLALLSNSAGLEQYDPDGSEADELERALGVSVIRHSCKKPSGDACAIVAHFSTSPSSPPVDASEVVMVGDRYLTDVAFGNRLGMLTVRVDPVVKNGKGEPRAVWASRAVEEALVRRRVGRGRTAPRQAVVEREAERRGEGRDAVLCGFVRR